MIKARGGFTLVELMITMVIMVILTVLAVVITGNIQMQARDNEREQDIQSIARGLEQRYNIGNSRVTYQTKGYYPGYNEFLHAVIGWDWCSVKPTEYSPCNVPGGYKTAWLPGISDETLLTPTSSQDQKRELKTLWDAGGGTTAQNNIDREALKNTLLANDNYVYESLSSTNTPCFDSGCARFNLYYRRETDGVTVQVKSKHQQ